MGVQYLGLNSLFASILQVLNLAELGVGSAMVYSMYKPIADDDYDTICALMRLYRTYYRIIGAVVAIAGLVLLPFIPHLIKGDIPPELNVYVLYLLYLSTTVLTYWLFGYKNSLLIAHQRVDISSKVTLITTTVQYGLQLAIIYFVQDYYLYLLVALATQAMTNIATSVVVTVVYPIFKAEGRLEPGIVKEINSRIKDLFTSKIGTVIINSSGSIVISAFLGLTMLAVYQNYFFILSSIIGIVSVVFSACTAGIGNSVIVESMEKNFGDLKIFTFIIAWLAGFCTCCLLCLYQPFMKIWVGQDLLLGIGAVICFCIYYFVYEINQLLNTYKDAAGIWHEDRFRPLVTALAILAMSLILVQFIGIYGVLISTVLSMTFIGMPWLLHNLFTVLFEKSYLYDYLKQLLRYVIVVAISCTICYFICQLFRLSDWMTLIIRGLMCCIVPNLFYFLVYRGTEEFKQSILLVERITKFKLKKVSP